MRYQSVTIVTAIFLLLTFCSIVNSSGECELQQKRVDALGKKLELQPANKTKTSLILEGILTSMDGKRLGFETTKHRVVHRQKRGVVIEKLYVMSGNDQSILVVTLLQFTSAETAQTQLIQDLATSSAQKDIMLSIYEKVPKGPGELCVIMTPVKEECGKSDLPLYYPVYFLLSNIAVSVDSFDKDIDPLEIARKIETIILAKLKH